MDISTALDNARDRISSAYSAISDKGGTIPASQNLQNLASAIQSISAGGVQPLSMAVTTPPTKTIYITGMDSFNPAGTVLTIYLDNNQKVLVSTGYTYTPTEIFQEDGYHTITFSFDWAGTVLTAETTVRSVQIEYRLIGGRIFYIHNDNGAEYMFFDSSYNVISDISVSGLANAYYYAIIDGTPTADKFYVYDNSGTSPTSSLKWATSTGTTNITANTIGSGKTNTATAMTKSYTKNSGTVFYWVTNLTIGGCNDWYVGSKVEYDKLRESGLVDWFSNKNIWSSVEYSSSSAYYWDCNGSLWYGNGYGGYKTTTGNGVALRSF